MNDNELHAIIPQRIVRGAILRSDGRAVGLVGGGAPAWDLRSHESRAHLAEVYHRILLAQDSPIDVYVVDGPPDLENEIAELYRCSGQSDQPILAAILDEMTEYLERCAHTTSSRHRLTIWAVAGNEPSVLPVTARRWISGSLRGNGTPSAQRGTALLAEAIERARHLADALASLGGSPPPRLLEAEEIARLWFRLIDPVRSLRYPLQGTFLERVRSVVSTGP